MNNFHDFSRVTRESYPDIFKKMQQRLMEIIDKEEVDTLLEEYKKTNSRIYKVKESKDEKIARQVEERLNSRRKEFTK